MEEDWGGGWRVKVGGSGKREKGEGGFGGGSASERGRERWERGFVRRDTGNPRFYDLWYFVSGNGLIYCQVYHK